MGTPNPNKIKIMIWRVSWNYIPTMVNLNDRRVAHSNKCPRCKVDVETFWHVFVECHGFLANVWNPNVACFSVEYGCFSWTETEIYMKGNLIQE